MIPQIEPWIDETEIEQVTKVLKDNWITEGPTTKKYEEEIQKITKSKNVIATANGTVALFMALKALNIGPDDEVLVPNITFIASANSVIMAGATPVFVEVDSKNFMIDINDAKEKISDKTKAIMPVHLYGSCADMDAINKFASDNNLKVIEDGAQAIGVKFNDKHAGTFGDIGMLSFYGNKTMTTAEGGILLTENDELAAKMYRLKNHGRNQKGVFIHEDIGYNFAFNDVLAAIGLGQLSKLDFIINRKQEIRKLYMENLPGVEFSQFDSRVTPVPWFTNILVDNAQKLSDYLKENEIGSRRFFYPLHMQPCYKDFKMSKDFKVSEEIYHRGLSLPSSVMIKDEDILKVCEVIKKFNA